MKAFEKSCKLLEEYQKAVDESQQEDPQEKERVLAKLKAYEEEAKNKPHKAKGKIYGVKIVLLCLHKLVWYDK